MRYFILELPLHLLPELEDVLLWQQVTVRSIPDLTLSDDTIMIMGWKSKADRDLALDLVVAMVKAGAGEVEYGTPLSRKLN